MHNKTAFQQLIVLLSKKNTGLRVGVDLSKITRTLLDADYRGFELNGDYRIADKLYIAGDVGTEERTSDTRLFKQHCRGQLPESIGSDYNMHNNWGDMDNLVYFGLRFGISNFTQTLKRLYDL